ncbi:MAG: RluA family pseudouridine synthase [Chloroflexota bacterium]
MTGISSDERTFVLTAPAGERLDVTLSASGEIGLSRSRIQALISDGAVTVDGATWSRPGARLKGGEVIVLRLPADRPSEAVAEDIPLDVVYEDADLIVINKPRGMVVHPAAGHSSGTLVNALLRHCPDLAGIGGVLRPGIVHRLDRDTTGLLVVAKSQRAHAALSAAIKARQVHREYLAVVWGVPDAVRGRIEAPIGRHPVDRKRMSVVEGGRQAVTLFTVVETFPATSLLRCVLETGRTHQIRVHLAFIGHPVVGDRAYGGRRDSLGITGQALHAAALAFDHPVSGQALRFEVPPPADLRQLLKRLRDAGE